jgi:flagellin
MSLTRINHNIAAQNAQRNLGLNTTRISQSMERLSSGLRINRAADDPSGLVMSEALRAQISGLDVVQQNVTKAVNLVKTGEGALTEVNALLRQAKDLALDSASNSTNNADTRAALQAQLTKALETIDQIATNTKYAGIKLLDGFLGMTTNIAGAGSAAIDQSTGKVNQITALPSSVAAGWAGDIELDVTAVAAAGAITTDTSLVGGVSADGAVTLNGVSISLVLGDNQATVVDKINARSFDTGVTAAISGNFISLTNDTMGSAEGVVLQDAGDILLNSGNQVTMADYGADAAATVTYKLASSTSADIQVSFASGQGLSLQDASGNEFNITSAANTISDKGVVANLNGSGAASFQIGLSVLEVATISVQSVKTDVSGLNVASIDISTVSGAQAALAMFDDAISTVSALRGRLGAFQANTLEAQGRSLAVARENLAASESAIRDTDFGSEMANFSTSQILVQAATSFLAQANSLPQNVLTLIRGG